MCYVLAVDHGTSGMKVALVDGRGRVLASAQRPTPLIHLADGGVEQDPEIWWEALGVASREAVRESGVSPRKVDAVCVSSTFSTTVALGRDGRHLGNAVTWLDGRGAPYVKEVMGGRLSIAGYDLRQVLRWVPKTGGGPTLSGKDDAAHVLLIKNRFPDIYAKTRYFLPSKDYLNYRLSGRAVATYDSIQLFWLTDIRDLEAIRYDRDLVRRLDIDPAKLPPLCAPTSVLCPLLSQAAEHLGLSRRAVVVAGSPDHQAACVGSGAVDDYAAHLYIGTSSWLECPVPFKKTDALHSIATFPTPIKDRYQVINEQDMAGGCLAFAAETLLGEDPTSETFRRMDTMAQSVEPGSGGVLFLPWLNGERTPVDDPSLRGGWVNLSHTSTREEMVRAVFEGVACNTRWSLGHVERFVGRRLDPITMVGGGACSDLWCQIMADTLNRRIRRPKDPRAVNARGAAFIAHVALDRLWFGDLYELVELDGEFAPDGSTRRLHDAMFADFLRFQRRSRGWFRRRNG